MWFNVTEFRRKITILALDQCFDHHNGFRCEHNKARRLRPLRLQGT